jgi:predicted phage terminase large subunit-like protein
MISQENSQNNFNKNDCMQKTTLHKMMLYLMYSRIRVDFISFLKISFRELNPSKQYSHNWHIDEVSKSLIRTQKGEITRLIINMPPRYLKSSIVSVCFVAWVLGRNPETRIITSSYSAKISAKHGIDTKKIMQSSWYKKAFPKTTIIKGQNDKTKFVTTEGGFRISTSSGGYLTGEGGDILIVDDPHKPATIESKTQREKVINWFENTLASRLDDKKKGVIIVVMQRLHPLDISGFLFAKKGKIWQKLVFPIIAERNEKWRKKGEPLHKERDDIKQIQSLREEMGEKQFLTQYQQNPPTEEGGVFKKEYFSFTDFTKEDDDTIVFSIDSANKIGISHDYTAITIWCIRSKEVILIECKKVKLEFGALLGFIRSLIFEYHPKFVLIEDKASGTPLIQELNGFDFNGKIVPLKTKLDKLLRLLSVISLFEKKKVWINEKITILDEIKEELLGFPYAKHDDVVDSVSHFLIWYQKEFYEKRTSPRIRNLY